MRVVVIPDIHGRLDALEAMLKHSGLVDGRGRWKGGRGDRLIQLGDLVDRGPQPRACVEVMMNLQKQAPRAVTVIKGNHEDMLLTALKDPAHMRWWLDNGGNTSQLSWGKDLERLCGPGGEQARWMESLPTSLEIHKVFFAHGGLKENNLDGKDEEALMWDRPPHVTGPYRALVCGHTPTESGRIEFEDNIFHCDIGLGHKDEAAFQYLNLMLTPTRLRWTVRVAPVQEQL